RVIFFLLANRNPSNQACPALCSAPCRLAVTASASPRCHGRLPQNVLDHYERNRRNVGSLDKGQQARVGTGLVGAPACGDVMKLQIEVDDKMAHFQDLRLRLRHRQQQQPSHRVGQGKSVDEASGIRNSEIAKELRLPPVKLHCSMLAEDAIKAALKDFKVKNADEAGVMEK
uniref:NifU_N domain-containing protein n=1 Tax=Macrostomum lignano TaxID=282301 RepID=A0A1I8F5C3_9PLAT